MRIQNPKKIVQRLSRPSTGTERDGYPNLGHHSTSTRVSQSSFPPPPAISCLSVRPSFCPSVHPSICLSVCSVFIVASSLVGWWHCLNLLFGSPLIFEWFFNHSDRILIVPPSCLAFRYWLSTVNRADFIRSSHFSSQLVDTNRIVSSAETAPYAIRPKRQSAGKYIYHRRNVGNMCRSKNLVDRRFGRNSNSIQCYMNIFTYVFIRNLGDTVD